MADKGNGAGCPYTGEETQRMTEERDYLNEVSWDWLLDCNDDFDENDSALYWHHEWHQEGRGWE